MSTAQVSDRIATPLSPRIKTALDQWQADLLDLTKANRLLYFRSGSHGLALTHPNPDLLFAGLANEDRAYTFYRPTEEDDALTVTEQLDLLLAEDRAESRVDEQITLETRHLPHPPQVHEIVAAGEPKKIETTLYRFRLKSRSALQEQGTNVLFVAFGLLDWTESVSSDVRVQSPLLLVPVRLDRDTALDPYRLTPLDEGIILNPSLARKLGRDFGLTLSLPPDEDEEPSLGAYLDHIRASIAGRHGWVVHGEAHLGLFSFAKYAMYADLEANRGRFAHHPVVRLISGEEDGLPVSIPDLPSAEYMDEHTKLSEIYQVLDADASQQEAIAAAKAGANLVIQGPPGTGKSQTIANIIAESLAMGRTVLFVSEKIAALRVVAKRLAEAGLGEFCLEAHSQDANKATIIRELERTFLADRRSDTGASLFELEQLAVIRRQLNAYVRALHAADNPLGLSAFRAHGEIAKRNAVSVAPFDLGDIEKMTQQRLAELTDVVQRLVRVGDVLLSSGTHPWHGCTISAFTPQIQTELHDWLRRLAIAADDLSAVQSRLYASLGLSYAASCEAATWLRDLISIIDEASASQVLTQGPIRPEWFDHPGYAALEALAAEASTQQEAITVGRAALAARFRTDIFSLATDEFAQRFEYAYTSWLRVFRADYRRDMGQMRQLQIAPGTLGYRDACEALTIARRVNEAEAWFGAHRDALTDLVGDFCNDPAADWQRILLVLQWIGRILTHFQGAPPELFVDALIANSGYPALDDQAKLVSSIADVSSLIESLAPHFDATAYRVSGLPLERAELSDVAAWARTKFDALSQVQDWIDYRQAQADAEALGLKPFVDGLMRDRPLCDTWRDVFLRQVYTRWLTWRYTEEPALARFRGQSQEETIAAFKRLDQWQLHAASARIAALLVQKRPPVTMNFPPKSEPALLLREASKKKRFRPLRKLFADLPNVLPALKPCMLMSPLSVAQFLGESAIEFDLVIFDEASQIVPADALGAIGRGKQVIVVGDNKQLPPTNFFGTVLQSVSDDDEEDGEPPESILDACTAAGLPQKRLRWHYRSRHEDLIAFSNAHFYDNNLITFPSPNADERAVEFVYVENGMYARSTGRYNRIEADRVIDLVLEHVRTRPDQSLGVITFSEAQMLAIKGKLDTDYPEMAPLLREDGPEGFFVKNLENVQGDERDVILFSVGYGPDENRYMTMNFGPLNREGGERRLNVAVTRARDHVKIVASFRPHEIDRSRTKAKGVHLLRNYLEFAEQGPVALLSAITAEGGTPDSPFEESVIGALTAHGLRVVSQVGVGGFRIDIGIKDDLTDRYVLGIECDGATYHSSATARDRDRLRQQVLENLGWRIHRIWSTDWIKDPEREIVRLLAVLDEAKRSVSQADADEEQDSTQEAAKPGVTLGAPTLSSMTPDGETATHPPTVPAPGSSLRIAHPYTPAILAWQGGRESFEMKSPIELMPLVEQCVTVEGPVHQDRVIRAVATSFGIARAGSRVRARVLSAIESAVKNGSIERWESFLYMAGTADPIVRESGGRAIDEIPPDEIVGCITAFLRIAFSISRDDLVTGVAREFGFDRTGSQVAAGIRAMIDWMLAETSITDVGGQIRLNSEQ
jgi:very-short-patch-repair endonuclease